MKYATILAALLGVSTVMTLSASGFTPAVDTISPDANLGISLPEKDNNYRLVAVKTGKSLGILRMEAYEDGRDARRTVATWSTDSHKLIVSTMGKWCPNVMVYIAIGDGKIKFQRDILNSIKRVLVNRVRERYPAIYARALKVPGFKGPIVDVRCTLDHNVKYAIKAALTLDPNYSLSEDVQLEVFVNGQISSKGEFVAEVSWGYTPDQIRLMVQRHNEALKAEDELYEQIVQKTIGLERIAFEKSESDWRSSIRETGYREAFTFIGSEWLARETELYRARHEYLRTKEF